ncbi:hypothetical protein FOIG_15416 [Fusarium odoratissimum NRRL 54006]|uniref:Uncharacterized protein n=2 Tax=Fusarium oxysporum species complex TaxID=171631 RepID=X0IR48_FUSO5|nr:uncharacterized protein FOIG_15416 [Fusarium odoratissimum NRRL 54006]EXL91378.1 hypothetical protein FOIG_15416 [Fusarium odoratissimum NRRL 54006]TXC09008.1 hypothetical protein FocTR4_00004380 [Fusarium oxysporum f. sp. cubense]
MGASEPDPPSQPQMRNTNSDQPSESFSYEHWRKLQNRVAQRRYRALASTSDNNVLQNGVHLAANSQAQKQKCRATADQNGVIGAQVPPQRHLPRRTLSSSQAFSNTNRGGPATDCTRELQDLSSQDETGHAGRRAGNVLSLARLLSEDPGCPQTTTGPGSGFQCSNHHENHGLPTHRARTWSNCSSKQQPSSSSYQEKLTTKANKRFSDLSQLYKVGVELDMIHYDEGFIQDLSTVKERFRQLADPGLIDLDQGNDDDTDQSRARPGENFAAAPHRNRCIAESQRQHLETNPPSPDPRDLTTKATYRESNLDRYRQDMHRNQGNSRVSTGHSSPRWTPSTIPESSEGSSLRTPSGLRRMQEYKADNSHEAGSRHEN